MKSMVVGSLGERWIIRRRRLPTVNPSPLGGSSDGFGLGPRRMNKQAWSANLSFTVFWLWP